MDIPECDSVLAPGLIAAYRRARYRVDHTVPFHMAVDAPCAELAAVMHEGGYRCAAFITAWNPYSAPATPDNDVRQASLLRDLRARGYRWIAGVGGDASADWAGEVSVLALGVNRHVVCELGRRHEQNAVLWAGADAIPRLLLLR